MIKVMEGQVSPVLSLRVTMETSEGTSATGAEKTKMRRRIFAEDPDWCLDTVPPLSNICLQTIATHFEENPVYGDLKPVYKDFVHKRLSTSLPLHVTAHVVDDGVYWRRCCEQRWGFCDVSSYGHSWKRMFFERHVASLVELFVPRVTEPAAILDLVPLCDDYVKRLSITQLLPAIAEEAEKVEVDEGIEQEEVEEERFLELGGRAEAHGPDLDHFDFNILLQKLTNLEELHLVYQVKNCGMNFEWSLFEMTAGDCESLGRALKSCVTLKILRLHQSFVNDQKCCRLVKHMLDHPSLRELDLSYNLIGDGGAKAISRLLLRGCLETLKMCNNVIKGQGAKAVAQALSHGSALRSLDLRLNRLGDEGGEAVAGALLRNDSLRHLHLGTNELTGRTATALAKALLQNNTLRSVNLSCNSLGVDGGKALQEAMSRNTSLTECDVCETEIEGESAAFIKQVVRSNRSLERKRNA